MNSDSDASDIDEQESAVKFYQQAEDSACSYLADENSNSIFLDPEHEPDNHLINTLHLNGFRRSGQLIYRPHCQSCQQCMSCRVINDQFQLSKNQKKAMSRNKELTMHWRPSGLYPEHFELYQRYINDRHKDGSMYPASQEQYQGFIVEGVGNHKFLEFFDADKKLVACCVVDFFDDGLSAVYSYYDPDLAPKSVGRFIIVSLILLSQQYNLPHTYLGYWIQDSDKMRYKQEYQPLQIFNGSQWIQQDSL